MEGGVEAGHLRQLRLVLHQHADRLEVVRLVQGRQRNELLQVSDNLGSQSDRRGVDGAAMHHPMANGHQPVLAKLLPQEAGQMSEPAIVAKRLSLRPPPFADDGARGIFGLESGGAVKPLDLPAEKQIKRLAPFQKERKLDAG